MNIQSSCHVYYNLYTRMFLGVVLCLIGLVFPATVLANQAAQAATPAEMNTLLKGEVIVTEDKSIDPSKEKGPATVVAKIVVPRSPEQIWPVIMSQEDLMCEERKVKSVKTVTKTGNSQEVDYIVSYNKILPTFTYRLRLEGKKPNTIHFRRVSGSFKDFEGSWRLVPLEGGKKTLLTYTLSLDPGFFAPKFLVVQAIKSDLPNMMKNVKTAIDKSISSKTPGNH